MTDRIGAPGFSRAELWKQLRRDERAKNREKLGTLKEQIQRAKARRKEQIALARSLCRAERVSARERIAALRAKAKEDLRTAVELEKGAAKGACIVGTGEAQSTTKADIIKAREALEAEQKFQRDMRRIESSNKARRGDRTRTTKREKRSESDDEVRSNIPEELIPLFERVKRSIEGSPRMSRTEAFLKYAEEHPEEVIDLDDIDAQTDALIAELERQQRSGRRNPMKQIRSLKAFNKGLAELAAGKLDASGNSDHQELAAALRRFRDRKENDGRFSELSAYINQAEEEGFSNRQKNRFRAISDLKVKEREERAGTYRGLAEADLSEMAAIERARSGRDNPCSCKNPTPTMTTLGQLTEIVWEGGRRRWALSKAPFLVYDKRGRLSVVYASKRVGSASKAETRAYAKTHWGQKGAKEVRSGSVAEGPFRELGRGVSITYTTRKGTRELVDWVHEWGEGARGRWTAPTVVEHNCGAPSCAGRGTIALDGGTYRVTERGIVG